MKLVSLLGMAFLLLGLLLGSVRASAAEGGELGNAFVPFASYIGRFSLEYNRDWHFNDLATTTNFAPPQPGGAAAATFFSVSVDPAGPATMAELLRYVSTRYPGASVEGADVAGLSGLAVTTSGVRRIFLQRAPSDLISIRFRSVDGERSDAVLSHMLATFKPF